MKWKMMNCTINAWKGDYIIILIISINIFKLLI